MIPGSEWESGCLKINRQKPELAVEKSKKHLHQEDWSWRNGPQVLLALRFRNTGGDCELNDDELSRKSTSIPSGIQHPGVLTAVGCLRHHCWTSQLLRTVILLDRCRIVVLPGESGDCEPGGDDRLDAGGHG